MLDYATRTTTIRLMGDCDDNGLFCRPLMEKIRGTVDRPKYRQGAAIMEMPESREAWEDEHRTARKRAWRAERLGYRFAEIDRSQFSNDIHEINVSLPCRQGRPMSPGYLEHRQQGKLPNYPCDLHNIRTYGILKDETLVAYLTIYRVCQLVLISMILGHGDHLKNDVMYLLVAGMFEKQAPLGGFAYYNLWTSGTPGLQYYKSKLGFVEGDIRWET